MFREIHSLKGAARAVSLADIEELCQAMETTLSLLKQQRINVSPALFDALHSAIDVLDLLLHDVGTGQKTVSTDALQHAVRAIGAIANPNQAFIQPSAKYAPPVALKPTAVHTEEKPVVPVVSSPKPNRPQQQPEIAQQPSNTKPDEKPVLKETVRVSTEKLGALLVQAEELITAKAMFKNNILEYKILVRDYTMQNKAFENQFRALAGNPTNESQHWVDLFNKQKENARKMLQEFQRLAKNNEAFQRGVSRTIDDLLIDIRKTLLVPFSSLLDIIPKIVRDITHEQKKEVHTTISGSEIEIDRRILEELKDPLIHLIRNCIDHGFETPEQRKAKNKPSIGKLKIVVTPTNNRSVVISISDDGAGINREKVLASALKANAVTKEAAAELSDKEILNLIFLSGVSSSSYITTISGRGLGMAIVAEKVAQLGGTIDLESNAEIGTIFTIVLPLSLATFRGVIVSAAGQQLIIPINTIERVIRIKHSDIKAVKNQETITIDGRSIGLVRLDDAIGLPHRRLSEKKNATFHVLILSVNQRRIAYLVDEIIGEQEGIVKSLGSQLPYVQNITGATLLGNGKIVPVINVAELMEATRKVRNTAFVETESAGLEEERNITQSLLVVEDSLTSRSLLRNILEASGYQVKTAVDGVEAFTFLNNERFDLIVSDIEMPRMNGFELTSKIRGDGRFSTLPIILITSLDAPEDRQRGMEAGANAYFIKSSFDQTNLVEIIKRLI